MKVVITDVSVFFDLYNLQVLSEFFDLDWEILTTDFVYNEIVHEEQIIEFAVFVENQKLHIIKINSEEESQIKNMVLLRPNKSFPDKTVLWKAKQNNCALLTCDSVLRKEAIHQNIEVHGSIWILSQLVENNKITLQNGIKIFEKLKRVNSRLPYNEIDKIINILKQKTEANGM
jgi:predicted nucleic acid-binding protein